MFNSIAVVNYWILQSAAPVLVILNRLISPVWWQNFLGFVISSQSVNSALYQNQTEFGISVLPVPLHVFSDVDSLLDEVVQILGKIGGHALLLQNPQDLVSCDKAYLGHTMGVTKDNTNL